MDKPTVVIPEGPAPTELQIIDDVIGDGAEATNGSIVDVHYVGVAKSTGAEFDASYGRGEPLSFPLGQGMVIPGWEQGIAGMKVGGRRTLIIPPHLAYGEQGFPGAIAPNETLVFVCDLVGVH